MRWTFEGRQRAARVGGKEYAKGTDVMDIIGLAPWRGEIDTNTTTQPNNL